jgi:hypothetical protein
VSNLAMSRFVAIPGWLPPARWPAVVVLALALLGGAFAPTRRPPEAPPRTVEAPPPSDLAAPAPAWTPRAAPEPILEPPPPPRCCPCAMYEAAETERRTQRQAEARRRHRDGQREGAILRAVCQRERDRGERDRCREAVRGALAE